MEFLKQDKALDQFPDTPMCMTDSRAWLFGSIGPVVHWDVTCKTEIPVL